MKRNITILITLGLLQAFTTFAQRNPSQEILVFFKEGVNQETRIVNGRSLKVADITSKKLKAALTAKGIEQSMLKVAMRLSLKFSAAQLKCTNKSKFATCVRALCFLL